MNNHNKKVCLLCVARWWQLVGVAGKMFHRLLFLHLLFLVFWLLFKISKQFFPADLMS